MDVINWLTEHEIVLVPVAAVVATGMIVGLFKFLDLLGAGHNWLFQKGFLGKQGFSPKFIMSPATGDERKDGGEFRRFFFSLSDAEKLDYLKFLEHRFVRGGFWTGFAVAAGIALLILMAIFKD